MDDLSRLLRGNLLNRSRWAPILLLMALSTTVVAAGLWGWAPPPPDYQERLESSISPFPILTAGSSLHVVTLGEATNYSTRLTLLSLQGLVNRDGVELYIDFEDADVRPMLDFLAARYNITYDLVDVNWTLNQYLPRARGLFVYDPRNPESINVGTTYSGIEDWVLVGPDTADHISDISGLPIRLDYAESDWASLSPVGAYDRALRELYPRSYDRLLAILPPDSYAIRDYLVATRTFVFYLPQAPLASPWDLSATLRILRAAPRGIPVLGWFRHPTLAEENAVIQAMSGEGKHFVGVEDVPNLTVLSALGRGQPFVQQSPPPASSSLQDKVYCVVAIGDGDNLDFAAGRMMEIWEGPMRGDFPVAWSTNPYFTELAPPYVDYYYSTATPLDSFVAGPSGAGYVYPDFLGGGDLEPFLDTSSRYMEKADLDVVWLLNSFPAYETHYDAETLAMYAEKLAPRGIVLDYDDHPVTQASWMVEGGNHASPVVRSTHLYTTNENFLGKLMATIDAWDGGPHFLWMTVYPFTHDLSDAKEIIDALRGYADREIELVSPQTLFNLLVEDFQRRASERLESMRGDPLASLLFSPFLESAERHLDASENEVLTGNNARAGHEAFLASQDLEAAARWEAIVVGISITSVIVGATLAIRGHTLGFGRRAMKSVPPGVIIATATAFFLVGLRSALDLNFWSYHSVGIGVGASLFAWPLGELMERAFPGRALMASSLVLVAATALTLFIGAAFPFVMLGAILVIVSALRGNTSSPYLLLPAFFAGLALGFLASSDAITFTGLSVALVAAVVVAPSKRAEDRWPARSKGAWPTSLAASLPMASMATYHSFTIGLRLELEGVDLALLGASLLLLCPLAALPPAWLLRAKRHGTVQALALALVVTFSALVFLVNGTLVTTVVLFGMVASLSLLAYVTVIRFLAGGGSLSSLVRPLLVMTTLMLMFLRIPPFTYSLFGIPFPQWMEYSLYAPQVIFAALAGLVLLAVLLFPAVHSRVTGSGAA